MRDAFCKVKIMLKVFHIIFIYYNNTFVFMFGNSRLAKIRKQQLTDRIKHRNKYVKYVLIFLNPPFKFEPTPNNLKIPNKFFSKNYCKFSVLYCTYPGH